MIGKTNIGNGSLNFSVKIYPTSTDWNTINGKENQIAILSDTPLNIYSISHNLTENPSEGDVVIVTADNSIINNFNILEKNVIKIYLTGAYQYENDAWVNKECKVFISSEWIELSPWLFNEGDQCEAFTNGWETTTAAYYSYSNTITDERSDDLCYITSILHMQGNSTANWSEGIIRTKQKVDLTNFNFIKFHISAGSFLRTDITKACISPTASGALEKTLAIDFTTIGDTILDISSLEGEYYIYLIAFRESYNSWIGNYEIDKINMYN